MYMGKNMFYRNIIYDFELDVMLWEHLSIFLSFMEMILPFYWMWEYFEIKGPILQIIWDYFMYMGSFQRLSLQIHHK